MAQQADARTEQVGLFLNPAAQRRVAFQAACGDLFGRLFVAEDVEQAGHILAQQAVGLLIIDLERYERGLDLAALGALVKGRNGAPVLLLCPYAAAGWLADLMAFGPLGYVIGPPQPAELQQRVRAALAPAGAADADADADADAAAAAAAADTGRLRRMLALRTRMQQAVLDLDSPDTLATRVCAVLCGWRGVVHASMFQTDDAGALVRAAQQGADLGALVPAGQPLQQSSLRHVFPGLLAACGGEFACLDAPEKADHAALAAALHAIGAGLTLGVPIRSGGPAAPLGALCLMFGGARALHADELQTLADLAQLAGVGLRIDEMSRDAEQLLARVTDLATTDALTGVANRRRGEALLEQEIKRARRYRAPLALIAFDIDHFKDINDRYGHPCGDAALRIVGDTTHAALRTSDLLARTGGDEFQIVVTHTNAIDALKMAEKLRAAIAATVFPGCDRLTVSLAVGQLADEESADALMLRVHAALARAKRAGRNCVELAMQ
ncbi:MAG: GGDEF domain-containing protein [Pseudomonadota bacterium]|nr:GGDEF domain-containing protein [Pseudomonadota bacterium]